MNVALVSESFIIRDGLKNVLESSVKNITVTLKDNIEKLNKKELEDLDLLLLDVENKTSYMIDIIKNIKSQYEKIKLFILDRNKDKLLFKQSIKYGVEGYMVNINDKEDFLYSVKRVMKGNNIYEPDLIKILVNEESNEESFSRCDSCIMSSKMDTLSKREIQVVQEVAKGLDNKTIANNLYITQYTVKKHVKSICDKLHLKNRKEIIVYMSNIN